MQHYNPAITYLKALGIILMVFGHSGTEQHVKDFIYMFHMPLFFFASGFCFKDKNLSSPKLYVQNKLKSIWWPYVKWGLLFLLLHNLLFHLNVYNDQYGYKGSISHLYDLSEFRHIAYVIVFKMQGAEQLLGGYWFLNALFFGSIISWITIRYIRNPLSGGIILLCICTILNKTCYSLPFFELQTQAFSAALLIVIGYAFAKFKIKPFNNWQIVLVLILTLVGSFFRNNMEMALVSYSNKIFAPYLLIATLATWCFYSLFEKMNTAQGTCTNILNYIGKNTLTILTWHFLTFKIVSLVIISIYDLPIARLAEFPVITEYSQQGWWIAYFIVAMVVTCGIAYCNKWIKNNGLKL